MSTEANGDQVSFLETRQFITPLATSSMRGYSVPKKNALFLVIYLLAKFIMIFVWKICGGGWVNGLPTISEMFFGEFAARAYFSAYLICFFSEAEFTDAEF